MIQLLCVLEGDTMDNILMLIITVILVALFCVVITFIVIKKKQNTKYKKEISELDVRKNQLLDVHLLSEMTKVKDLVKTDNLQKKLDSWDNTFTLIKDDRIPKLTDMISEADFLIDKREYNQAIKKIADIELEIERLKCKTERLVDEIKIITNSEERNRALITKLKVVYRELENKFSRTIKDFSEVATPIEEEFHKIDAKFQKFEDLMDHNDYVEVEKIVIDIENDINHMKEILDDGPSIVLMSNVLIPGKIEEAKVMYARMQRDGYPLDYLNVEYNLSEIQNKVKAIMDKMNILELGDSKLELKTILDYFNSLYNDFDKEKECKDTFKEGTKKFRHKLEKINKVVYDVYIQIDDIKVTYDLTDEEINKFSVLNRTLEEINEDFKSLLDHSKTKTFAYSKLNDELEGLKLKLSRLQDDLDYQLRSITSMKDDEYRAKEQLDTIQNLLKQDKYKLKDYKLPIIPSSYFVELKEAQDAIREIVKELDKKPIVIKILNIRVDTARDLVFKIYNKTNDMIKSAMLSEKMIIYGNRYRSLYPEIDSGLEKATTLFYKGQYEQSLNLSIDAISVVESNPLERIQKN